VKELALKKSSEGDKITALDKSVKDLVNFIERGGEVDFIIPEDKTSGDVADDDLSMQAKSDLRIAFKEIRRLEHHIKQIEHNLDSDCNNEQN
jgi:hypothetical protein